ncbi:MAG: choice-of-anchor D domain-containing protein [Bacteroidetes bacterium]|nr:choice-of-anchor D domain-containing protein [Bacteroidota bacterium]
MKKILICILLITGFCMNVSYSQNTMFIDTLSGHSGDTLTFSLKINNAKPFTAFQTDIQFPAQLTYVNNSAALTSRANGHGLGVSLVSSSVLRVVAYSMTMNQFTGTSGAVMTFKCVSGNVPGVYYLSLATPIISDSANTNILTASYSGKYTVLGPKISFSTSSLSFGRTLLGTNINTNLTIYNNGTSTLTVSKLTTDTSAIRFTDSSGFTIAAGGNLTRTVRLYADSRGIKTAILKIYSDDIFDTVHVVNATGEVYTTNELYLNTVTVKYGYTGTMKIRMKNFDNVGAFQTSITLPASITYVPGSVTLNPARTNDHVITASVLSGNILKIISYSPTGKTYYSNDSTIAQFDFVSRGSNGSYSIPITEGIISDTLGVNVCSNVYGGTVTVKAPYINIPTSVTFDTISYLDSNFKSIQIQNTGTDTLVVTGASATESSFSVVSNLPFVIPPSTSYYCVLRFKNAIEGLHTGNFVFTHSDSLRSPSTVSASGVIYKPARLKVTNTDFVSRDTAFLPFAVNNKKPFVALQFDVTLPSQCAFISNSALLTSRANGHTVSTSTLGNGDIRVIAYSMNQYAFSGDTGDVVKLKLAINADTGIYNVSVKNVIISDSNNANICTGYDNGYFRVNPLPPLLINPSNGSVGNPVNLNLVWRRSAFASVYHLQFAYDSLFTNRIINDSTMTDSTRSLTGLTPLTNYYWRVRIKNYSGASRYTGTWKFRIIGTPTQSVLVYPPRDTVNMPVTSITFKWNKAVDQTFKTDKLVAKYWFELSADSLFTSPLRDSILTDTLKTVTAFSYITKYYWRIKAKNEIGWGAFTPFSNFTTIIPPPSLPVLLSPANNTTGVPPVQVFVWTKSSYAAGYVIQFSTDSLFGVIVLSDSTLTDTLKTVTGLNPLTYYWWRVQAKNINGNSGYTSAWKFRSLGAPYGVVLNSPANNSVNQPVNINFNWYKGIDQVLKKENLLVGNYWFEIAADSNFASLILRDTVLADTLKYVAGLSNNTTYFWRVKAKNQTGWGAFSQAFKFTTIVAAPSAPLLISPANNSTGLISPVTFIWTKPLYASGYVYEISSDSLFNIILITDSTLTDSIKTVSALNPLTNYWWRVKAKNIGGQSAYTAGWKFRTMGSPSCVQLYSPGNYGTNQPVNITFIWYKAADQLFDSEEKKLVSRYWFEISTDSTFAAVLMRDTTLSDTTKVVSGLTNNTLYFWRVKAKNEVGWNSFCYSWRMTTIVSAPAAPVLLSPANGSMNVSLTPVCSWNSVAGAVSYRYQISTDSLFNIIIWDTSGVNTTSVTLPAGRLSQTTKYYWRVNGTNAGGTSSWSSVWNFTTLALPLSLNLKVYLEGYWDGAVHVSDTIIVYLAGSVSPHNFADTSKIVLSATGTAVTTFSRALSGSYYIVVQHRNHLQTWSAMPQSFIGGTPLNYDFTTSSSQAYGNNMKQLGSAWMLYGGDANVDGSIDAIDISVFISQFGLQGYLECDFNGDGDVNAMDVQIITQNFGLTTAVPTILQNQPGNSQRKKINILENKTTTKNRNQKN